MIIKRNQLISEFSEALRSVFDDDEFVQGVLILAETDADKREILNFIKNGDNVNAETVTVKAMNIDIARYGDYNARTYN